MRSSQLWKSSEMLGLRARDLGLSRGIQDTTTLKKESRRKTLCKTFCTTGSTEHHLLRILAQATAAGRKFVQRPSFQAWSRFNFTEDQQHLLRIWFQATAAGLEFVQRQVSRLRRVSGL